MQLICDRPPRGRIITGLLATGRASQAVHRGCRNMLGKKAAAQFFEMLPNVTGFADVFERVRVLHSVTLQRIRAHQARGSERRKHCYTRVYILCTLTHWKEFSYNKGTFRRVHATFKSKL